MIACNDKEILHACVLSPRRVIVMRVHVENHLDMGEVVEVVLDGDDGCRDPRAGPPPRRVSKPYRKLGGGWSNCELAVSDVYEKIVCFSESVWERDDHNPGWRPGEGGFIQNRPPCESYLVWLGGSSS